MKRYTMVFIFLLSIWTINCQTTEIIFPNNGIASDTYTHKERQGSTLYKIELYTPHYPECNDKVKKIVIRRDLIDSLYYYFIAPFYMTRTVEIYCR